MIVLEGRPQTLAGRFMYGPLDVVSLTGEKVSVKFFLLSVKCLLLSIANNVNILKYLTLPLSYSVWFHRRASRPVEPRA